MNLRHLAWPLLAALLFLGGCRSLPPAAPPVAVISPSELLARLPSRQQHIQSFQGKGRLTFLSPERNYSGTCLLAGRLPAALKADVLDPLGRTLLSFSANREEVQVFSPHEGKLFRGQANPKNLAALIPPTVTLPQALHVLVGLLPLSTGAPDQCDYDAGAGQYRLEWRTPAGALQERLWVEAREFYPVRAEWFGDAAVPRFTAEMGDFGQLVPGLPGKITLKTGNPKMELRLVYREMRLNPPLTAADLTVEPPPGITVVPLGP